MNRHLAPLAAIVAVADALVDDLLDRESSPDVGSLLSVLRVDPVFGGEGSGRSDDASVFSEGCHVKGYFSYVISVIP